MTQNLPKTETISLLLASLNANAIAADEHQQVLLNQDCHFLLQEAALHQKSSWAAHMTPNLAPYSLLGQQIVGMHQGNLLSPELYPFLKQTELTTLSWLKKHFHQPYARFTHGGSYSNLEALWQARDIKSQTNNVVYGSKACHYSVKKACDILGLRFQALDTDNNDRLLAETLRNACMQTPPVAIVLNIGTSAAGSIDPLSECVSIAAEYDCWLHIDAAWGGSVIMLPEQQRRYPMLAQADSISFDPHKSLFVPRPCSVLMSRHKKPAQTTNVDYLDSTPETQLAGSYGGEVFLPLWLNLQILGEEWFYQKTRQRLAQARLFGMQLSEQTDWQIMGSETGIVCFETKAEQSLAALVEQGIFSQAKVNGRPVYRAVFASHLTQESDLVRAIRPYL